jgi:hypothetical protein
MPLKRIQLFEFEDLPWFPESLRACMTRMIRVVHCWARSPQHIAGILADVVRQSGRLRIVDLCSGDGGPMIEALSELHTVHELPDVSLVLTDLYPSRTAIRRIQTSGREHVEYREGSIDAATFHAGSDDTVRTIIAGFHHMPPMQARTILREAMESGDPILIYEISDNSRLPKHLWWVDLPMNVVFGFVVAARVRPMTWTHCVFSFVLPVVPFCFGWDAAVSNVRTYSQCDLPELLSGIESDEYRWTTGLIDTPRGMHLYLLGMPRSRG